MRRTHLIALGALWAALSASPPPGLAQTLSIPSCPGCGLPLYWSPDGQPGHLQPSPQAWHQQRHCPTAGRPASQLPGLAPVPIPEAPSQLNAPYAAPAPTAPAAPGETTPTTPPSGAPATPATPSDVGATPAPNPPAPSVPSYADLAGGADTGALGPAAAGASPALASGLGGAIGGDAASALVMFGDQAPIFTRGLVSAQQTVPTPPRPPRPPRPEPPPSQIPGAVIAKARTTIPWIRSFKMADNQSPLPQDRFYFSFNYFDGVNEAQNRGFGGLFGGMEVYRYLFGLEKTFLDGYASIGVRDSVNTLTTSSPVPGLSGTSTAMGDLSVFTKFILLENLQRSPSTGNGLSGIAPVASGVQGGVLTGGLAVRAPTGPSNFAGTPYSFSLRNTGFQPFLGYYWSRGNIYVQGFEAIDVPTDSNDVTMLYNDAAIGYYLFRSSDPNAWIHTIAPTVETHVNVPLNHTNLYDITDPFATDTVVDFTYGLNIGIGKRSLLSLGMVTPITGVKPFDYEALALLNVYYGRTARTSSITAPVLGY